LAAVVGLVLTVLAIPMAEAVERARPKATAASSASGRSVPAPADGARWGDFVGATDAALVVSQPDGSTFRAQLTDAEVGGALESDGYTVVKDDAGWWRYASDRGDSGLVPGPARVGLDERPAALEAHLGRTAPVWSDGQGTDVRAQLLRQLQVASRQASMEAAAAGGPRVFRFPVVLFATWYDTDLGQTAPSSRPATTSTTTRRSSTASVATPPAP
jgi:hypothetical protein